MTGQLENDANACIHFHKLCMYTMINIFVDLKEKGRLYNMYYVPLL